jgi:hypothetical protein
MWPRASRASKKGLADDPETDAASVKAINDQAEQAVSKAADKVKS